MKSHAIVSLFSGSDIGYYQGLLVLGKSLDAWTPKEADRVLFVENGSLSKWRLHVLALHGWQIREVEPIRSQPCKFKAQRWPYTFSKLYAHSLEEYDKVLFLDADCMVVGEYYERVFGTDISKEKIAACWVTRNSPRFNAGIMLIEPSMERFKDMYHKITTLPAEETHAAGSDQSFQNLYFNTTYVQLPDKYNLRHFRTVDQDARIVHLRPHPWRKAKFSEAIKPWINKWHKLKEQVVGSGRAIEIYNRVRLSKAKGVEVGTFKGDTADTVLRYCPNLELTAVDMWDSSHYSEDKDKITSYNQVQWDEVKAAYKAVEDRHSNLHTLKMHSLEAASRFKDEELDFVFIDAEHTYSAVKKDIAAWLPKVKSGGWIGGRDYGKQFKGVTKAVDEFFKGRIRKGKDATWFVTKK